MARRPALPKLGNRWSLDYLEPPAKRAVYAQRLWALRCYRSVTTREVAMLAGLTPADVDDLQSDPGRLDLNDPDVRPAPQQRQRLTAIALALHVSPHWLCGASPRRTLPAHAGLAELLAFAAQTHALREQLAARRQPQPKPWTETWAWMEQVESAWHLLLTQPRDTRLLKRLADAVAETVPPEVPLPTVHRIDLLQRAVFPSLRLRLARDLFPAPVLARLGAALIDDDQAPTSADIARAQAAVRRFGRRAQELPAQPPSRRWLVDRMPSITALDEPVALDAEATVLLDLALGDEAYPKLATALVAARAQAAEDHQQQKHQRVKTDDKATIEDADELHLVRLYRAYATRFPRDPQVGLDVAVQQFRRLKTAMQVPRLVPDDQPRAPRHARQLPVPSDRLVAVLDLLAVSAGRLVETAAFMPELRAALHGADPQPILAALVRVGWVARRDARVPYLLILDADDRRLRPKQAWKVV